MAHRDDQTLLLQKETSSSADRQLFCDLATLTIVFTQISFLIFAWTFAGFMTRSIQLPDRSAGWIQNNPSDAQLIVALVSTILALISSLCLCKIAQYALVRRLALGPLPLSTMIEWAKLAQGTISLNADSHKWSWTLSSVVWISLLGFLTTAWVTLLAPQNIVVYRAIQGNQANLLHPSVPTLVVDALISTPQPPPGFNLTPTRILNNTNPGGMYLGSSIDLARNLMEAGLSAAVANVNASIYDTTDLIGIPNAELVSNISTGGIFLSGFEFPGPGDYRIYPGPSVDPYEGLSRSFSTAQQGFTANVSCGWPNNAGTVPAITPNAVKSVQFSVDGDSGDTWTQYTHSWSTTCSPGVTYSTYGVTVVSNTVQDAPDNNLLRASVCFGQDFSGLSNQSFLVLLSASSDSIYSTQACEVTPLVTTVQATYDAAGVVNIAQPPLEQHPLSDSTDTYNTSALLWFTAYVIWTTIVGSQGLDGNQIGENLSSLSPVPINQTVLTESYLRGMVEYLGSILNNAATRTLGSMPPNITADMMVQSNGMLHIQTFGWSFHLRSHGPSLAGITLVALLTVALGVFAMLPIPLPHNAGPAWGDPWTPLNPFARFNPAATMDVLLASTAGDLSKVVTEPGAAYRHGGVGIGTGVGRRDEDGVGAREGARGTRERLGVVLETTDEGRPALRTVSLGSVTEDRTGVGLDVLRFFRDRRSGSGSADVVQRDEYIELGEVSQESTVELKDA